MRRFISFALPLLLSLWLPAALVLAGTPLVGNGSFTWNSTRLPPTIPLSAATRVAAAYLSQQTEPDQAAFVQITNVQRRGNITEIVFYGWQLHYAGLVSVNARCGQTGLTLLVNGASPVYGGEGGSTLLWPPESVLADIPDPSPSCPDAGTGLAKVAPYNSR